MGRLNQSQLPLGESQRQLTTWKVYHIADVYRQKHLHSHSHQWTKYVFGLWEGRKEGKSDIHRNNTNSAQNGTQPAGGFKPEP